MKESALVSSRTEASVLPPPEQKAQFVQANFDQIANHYDSFNDWITLGMHRRWKRKTVRASGLAGKTARVLDLCCGSGDLTLAFLQILAPGSVIRSIDFSANMLSVLRSRLGAPSRDDTGTFDVRGSTIIVREGDATKLNFIKEFDAVSIGFGLRNVTDRSTCLRGIHRALRQGGRLLLLDVGHPPRLIAPFFRLYFEKIVQKIGHLIHGDQHRMYDYLPASARLYPDQRSIKGELEQAGFRDVRIVNFMLGSCALHVATA